MESMDTVSLQAVTLADGSTAYIQHDSKTSFSDGQIMDGQVIQLEDGSAAYVQHVSMPKAGKETQSPAVYKKGYHLNITLYAAYESGMMGSSHLFVFYLCLLCLQAYTDISKNQLKQKTSPCW